MRFKNLFISAIFLAAVYSCNKTDNPNTKPDGGDDKEVQVDELAVPQFAKGADISWITEMESKGVVLSGYDEVQKECTAIMKDLGMNSIRLRVWVNPTTKWCNAQDVLEKARRASKLGMNLMIDFHYSDSWADPGKQNVPAAWKSDNISQLVEHVAQHTKEVLKLLRDNGIDVSWVQVGNETPDGFLWELGRASTNPANFASLVNAGSKAVKEIYPKASVIVHVDNAYDYGRFTWLFDILKSRNVKYDMIGMSLYPSYWDSSIKGYPEWETKTKQALANIPKLYERYGKELIFVETGMPVSEPDKAYDMLSYLLKNAKSAGHCRGVFYWEPESSKSNNSYDYGAFEGGKPTKALKAFSEN